MTNVMIHRALPSAWGTVIRPGEYQVRSNAGGVSVYTAGKVNALVGRFSFEAYNKASLEGWLTEIVEPVLTDVIATPYGLAGLDQYGQLMESRLFHE